MLFSTTMMVQGFVHPIIHSSSLFSANSLLSASLRSSNQIRSRSCDQMIITDYYPYRFQLQSIKNDDDNRYDELSDRQNVIMENSFVNNESLSNAAWSQWQDWALIDNLSTYLVPLHKNTMAARWRAMVRDIPELNGFSIEFVQLQYKRLLDMQNKTDEKRKEPSKTKGIMSIHTEETGGKTIKSIKLPTNILPELLPLLDGYTFEKNDQMRGYAYNINGVADGTILTTPPLKSISTSVSKGWIESEVGGIVYELGVPLEMYNKSKKANFYSLDFGNAANDSLYVSGLAKDTTLLNLGALTGMLLLSATAFNSISHHVSIHVYWV